MFIDFAAISLLIFGLMGIYGCQIEESGISGFLGFLLTVLMSCIGLSLISWMPESLEVSDAAETLTLIMGLFGLLGYIVLGIGTWRANKLQRWTAVFWPVGTLISAVGGMVESLEILHVIGITIWALGILGAGFKLWSTIGGTVVEQEVLAQV
jgi:hypothetical protein